MAKEERLSWKNFRAMIGPSFRGTSFYYAAVLFFILMAALAQVAEPVITGRIIDALISNAGNGLFEAIVPLVGLWAAAYFASIVFSELGRWLSWKMGNRVGNRFLVEALDRILGWDPQRFSETSTGVIGKRLDAAWHAAHNLSSRIINEIVPILFTSTVVFITGLWLDWRMTLVSLVSVPLAITLTLFVYAKTDKRQSKHMEAWESLSKRILETINNIVPIKAFAQERVVSRQQAKAIDKVTDRQLELNVAWAWLDFGNGSVRILARLVLLFVGAYFITQGTLSVGTLITFIGMLSYLLAPFDYTLADVMRRISEIRTAFARLSGDWFKENQIVNSESPVRLGKVQGEIAFDGVSFRYPGKEIDTLHAITLRVPAGTSLALVGPSGSGKSTLVRFINRFLDPKSGTVTLDGHDVRSLYLADLREAVGVVQQDTVLFNDTILNNIRFAKPNATQQQVVAACKRAQADEFIRSLADGYKTMVGERGVRLSGGERQRIALARVFLASPPVLILDESTSALDSETEHKLQIALKEVMKERTTIIIAHRLSTVYMADQIAVLDRGKLIELGTHADLLETGGMYDRLWKLQSGGYLPE
ncbi:MAG: ABC transporter related-protein [Candidatus Uhrbacteria bacterium GW2011_GWD2_52_7]|uniref:ABC transporter related-protein n=1 Tax=Candidatus Uhrbacteria bacterium GW2011_GWD2_52_7 TaxID=1618989 RepID=A0A0G2AAT7_9BACT|nr:MAG: ABC transporter related-protein [Candidatus Uhrbacteria bacterium GW2011_GWD2_52_7]